MRLFLSDDFACLSDKLASNILQFRIHNSFQEL